MNANVDLLYQAALALPEAERAELVDSLIATFKAGSPPLSDEWRQEIQRRNDEIDAGTVELIPWSVVRDQVRAEVLGIE